MTNHDSTAATNAVIAANVRRLRAERGMTLQQVAEGLESRGVFVDYTAIHRVENNRRDVRLKEARQLAAVFGVSLESLLAPPGEELPEQVERLVAQLADAAAVEAEAVARVAELTGALAAAQQRVAETGATVDQLARQLRESLRVHPEAADQVALALAGSVPERSLFDSLPEAHWPRPKAGGPKWLLPPTDAREVLGALREKKSTTKGRKPE